MESDRLKERERRFRLLSRWERVHLHPRLGLEIGDARPGIESQLPVCPGAASIAHARLPVRVWEPLRRLGMVEAELVLSYCSLRVEDLANAWGCLCGHRELIERERAEHEELQ